MKLMSAYSRVTRLSAALVLLVGGSSLTAYAQQTEEKKQTNKRVIEEVIVSATKREQVSQDVPISMSVMSDIFLKEQGITDIGEALLFTPNFSITETNNSVTPQCRGFVVETINPGFEPPCGLAVDGVAYTRPSPRPYLISNGLRFYVGRRARPLARTRLPVWSVSSLRRRPTNLLQM
jgi:outer membrane receptor protein involved in Fe transport